MVNDGSGGGDAVVLVRALGLDPRVGRIEFCLACGFITCACAAMKRHEEGCRFRLALTCPGGIECDHGRDVCAACDPCTCGAGVAAADFGPEPIG